MALTKKMISNNSYNTLNLLNIRAFNFNIERTLFPAFRSLRMEKGAPLFSFLNHLSVMKNRWKAAPLKLFVLVFAIGFLIFGIYQTAIHGFNYSYWIFIYSIILFVVYGFIIDRKNRDSDGK